MSIQQQPLLAYGAVAGGGDPDFANVVSLLHFDGANGSTVFTDQTGKTWTRVSGAEMSTAQSVFGGASGFFSPSNSSQITTPDHADWDFGSGAFTLEGRIRWGSLVGAEGVLAKPNTGTNYSPFLIYHTGGNLVFSSSSNNTSWDVASAVVIGAIVIDTWYAWAVSRVGSSIYLFMNGTLNNTVTFAGSLLATTTVVNIGCFTGAGNFMHGYNDELRVTKGIGRYSANYTLATAAFPNS